MHGKDPSRGAEKRRDAAGLPEEEKQRLREEAGTLGQHKGGHTNKSEAKQQMDQEAYEERKAHSKSGANTGQRGPEYLPRKNHSDHP